MFLFSYYVCKECTFVKEVRGYLCGGPPCGVCMSFMWVLSYFGTLSRVTVFFHDFSMVLPGSTVIPMRPRWGSRYLTAPMTCSWGKLCVGV